MTAIRSERLGADGVGANKSGPEEYTPKHLKAATPGDLDQAAIAFEGQIREFVRRDVAYLRKPRPETESGPAAGRRTDGG